MATSKSVVLVTGANTGIGYEVVKALAASDIAYTILLGSRSLDKGKAALEKINEEVPSTKSEIHLLQIDIEDDKSIEAAFNTVQQQWGRVDALVNNAGAAFDQLMKDNPGPSGIREAWDRAYSLNVTSTQVFTHTFIPLLLASASPRLLFVTSGLSSLENFAPTRVSSGATREIPAGWPKPAGPSVIAYRSSKTALNMMMLDWARLLKSDGVKVFGISPGFLATGLGGSGAEVLKRYGAGDPALGGTLMRDVVEGKRDGDAGKIVDQNGVQPW
ncbi:NAD(P)-binding protein [Aaosphaeria arxii CBS 175.79]|uniref:NAD(P)-binding protein n=1 Tax=Aaosphaeria arxii CBS 175.79 TaxID=1450172 RepID=A0A6A5Y248_9PLEO|nr:NAD(P)-binding protein [Aaosphaeria arxii CBS 175.79]KAF2019293.1 NAD(P)-binding protein [Aaosphaeria arxii CBS 175.79]